MLEILEEITDSNRGRCFIGFDGFTDEIIDVVQRREDLDNYTPYETISSLGDVLTKGKSLNLELITKRTKIGGNAPILAHALSQWGHPITLAAPIGTDGSMEPLFEPLTSQCTRVIPLGPSAHSDALEFTDGKIILGKLDNVSSISIETLLQQVAKEELISLIAEADLFVSANWTMLPHTHTIWRFILTEVIPHLSPKPRHFFVDLADPKKRPVEDLKEALALLKDLTAHYHVILGLNTSEAHQVGSLLNCDQEELLPLCQAIQKESGLNQIVIHHTKEALTATTDQTAQTPTFHIPKPKISTGAGDNFNAGFCHALLLNLSLEECLQCGVATAGYYVRHGHSPTNPQLLTFLSEANI
ncbi:MAG: hypothetical protein KDK65_02460 [Chlamydiia bacterium]|nr:hypothetical protein [Chlamydiia bacterium]